MPNEPGERMTGTGERLKRKLFGAPKEIRDPTLFHKLSLIPVLAWVGLGADGLSSSSYGPEEAFKALGQHTYLSVFLALATALTVFIISYTYARVIEHFPFGGGGYLVASHMLGERVGLVSGAALLVDYVLTITVSIASCTDAIFSYLPMQYHPYKVEFGCLLILLLVVLNIRGIKESIYVLAPIFVIFIATHAVLLLDGLITHREAVVPLLAGVPDNLSRDISTIGFTAIAAIFLRAYSLGGGTYTGIEAVSNGLQIMREPRVQTGKRTMLYMALSLAFTAGTLFICYALIDIKPVTGRTLNAVLADTLYADWPGGEIIALVTIFAEGALLLVAAQTGFVGGPRVMGNMAADSWFPHRFAALSERLTMHNGIVMLGVAALLLIMYTKGSVAALVIMYSINVFLTFTLSQIGMSRYFIRHRHVDHRWVRHLAVHQVGLALCLMILVVTVYEKFTEGGWLTLILTGVVIAVCFLIRRHYVNVRRAIKELDDMLLDFPIVEEPVVRQLDREAPTAVQLVTGYSGAGIHTLLSIITTFPNTYHNIVFVSVAVIDSGSFKGVNEIEALEQSTRRSLEQFVELAQKLGLAAEYRMETSTDVVDSAVELCTGVASDYARATVFTGQLTFSLEKWFHRLLHNETAFAIQRRLQWEGITTVILPIRVKV